MKIVQIESPFSPSNGKTVEENIEYARKAVKAVLLSGFTPFASHLLYTQDGVLDDNIPSERKLGIDAGFEFYRQRRVDECWIYTENGISSGMIAGIECALESGIPLVFASIEFHGSDYHTLKVLEVISKLSDHHKKLFAVASNKPRPPSV
uniref:DUF7768 domain-containing protein n=1 Tax=Rhizobium phage IG49 TaxID=3129228 RepID=A0AAU8HZ04_9CAUD